MKVGHKVLRAIAVGAEIVPAVLRGRDSLENITVCGRPAFRAAVVEALLLLRGNRLPAWDTLSKHVGFIFQGRRTFVGVTTRPAFMFIDGPHSKQEPAMLAGTLAFLACSCELHRTFGAEFPGVHVPREVYAGRAAEARCESAYRECLEALGK
jgi:hypothetical protein